MAKSDRRPPPAFQFYASDTLADEDFMFASMGERGLLFSMMAACWVNGSVPSDPALLARAVGSTEVEVRTALTERVLGQFEQCHTRPGFLEHPDLVRQRREMEHRGRAKSEGGVVGAKKRWAKHRSHESKPMADVMGEALSNSVAIPLGDPMADPMADPMGAEESREEVSGVEKKGGEPACREEREKSAVEEFVQKYEEAERNFARGLPAKAAKSRVRLATSGCAR